MSPLQTALIRRIAPSSWASSSSVSRSRLPAVLLPLPLPLSSSSSSSSCRRSSFDPPRSFFHSSLRSSQDPPVKTPIGQIQRRLQITFTCTAPVPVTVPEAEAESARLTEEGTEIKLGVCSHRSSHEFSKQAYEKGLVLIECPACKNRHLIADHLEWFATTPSAAHPDGLGFNSDSTTKRSRTIEDLMREKGEEVKWLKGGSQGDTWTVEG